MRKSLSILLAITLVFSMFGSLAFAADADLTVQEKYDALAAKGIFAGINAEGDAGLDQPMDRAQFARVAALILGLDGISADGDTKVVTTKPFSDVELNVWYTEEIAAAKEVNIMVGNTDGTFNPSGDITVQELAVVVAKLLTLTPVEGAEVEGASSWAADDIQAILDAGLTFPTNYTEPAIRSDLANMAYTAYVAIEAAKVPVVPATLEVTSVSSTNLKTFTVVFNQAVDKDTVTNDGTVKVTDVPSTVSLSDDGKTASVVLTTAAAQSKELEFVINGVKTKDAKEIKDYKVKVVALDSTVPVATGATFINHKEIEVQFSEPMNFSKPYFEGLSNVKVDGATVIATATPDFVKNTVTFGFTTVLKNGTVKLEVSDIKDFATFSIAKAEFDVLVVEDTTAPVLASAEVKNLTTIEVAFNERVATTGTFKVNGTSATVATVGTDGKKFSLTAFGTLNLGATVDIKVAYKGQKDVVGNEVKDEVTFSFKVVDDTALPTVTSKVEAGNKVTLTFSKSMSTTDGTIKVQDKDKKDVGITLNVSALTFKTGTNNTVLELAGSDLGLQDDNAATFYLVIKDMKDSTVRTNLLPEATLELSGLDTKKPTVATNYLATAGATTAADTVTFYFSEAVDADTAKNLSNYLSAGTTPLNAITDAKFKSISGDGKAVTITYPNVVALAPSITVFAIKDVAGNMMLSSGNVVTKYAGTTFIVSSAKATAKNKVEVTFSSAVGTVDPSALALYDTGTTNLKTTFVSASADGAVVTFTTASDIGAAAAAYDLKVTNNNGVTNVFGLKLTQKTGGTTAAANGEVAQATITDEIKATVSDSKRGTTVATYDDFIITFDEEGTLDPSDVIVRNKDNAIMILNTDYTLTMDTTATTGDVLTVNVITLDYNDVITVQLEIGAFVDAGGNSNAYKTITTTDKIVSAVVTP